MNKILNKQNYLSTKLFFRVVRRNFTKTIQDDIKEKILSTENKIDSGVGKQTQARKYIAKILPAVVNEDSDEVLMYYNRIPVTSF